MNNIQKLIDELEADISKAYDLYDQYRSACKPGNSMFNLGRAKALENLIPKLKLLLKTERRKNGEGCTKK